MSRAGFTDQVIAKMKARIGDQCIEDTLQRIEAATPVPEFRHDPIVYYMRMDRLVKIGTTTNITLRAGMIMPQGILAVEWGSFPKERDRHAEFINFHSHGEWYWLREPLWEHINQLREDWTAATGASVEAWLADRRVRNGQFPEPGEVE